MIFIKNKLIHPLVVLNCGYRLKLSHSQPVVENGFQSVEVDDGQCFDLQYCVHMEKENTIELRFLFIKIK